MVIFALMFFAIDGVWAVGSASRAVVTDKDKEEGASLTVQLDAPEAMVLKAVKDIADDGIVHGTYAYEKDQTFTGAELVPTTTYYGKWTGDGTAFYKVREDSLAPRHFKESADVGTIFIRYVVKGVSAARTRLQIDAVFVEDARRKAHASDGSVETSEFSEIQLRVRELQHAGEVDASKIPRPNLRAQEAAARESSSKVTEGDEESGATMPHIATRSSAAGAAAAAGTPAAPVDAREQEVERLDSAESSLRSLQQQLQDLKHDMEVRVRAANTDMKSAPFETATPLQKVGPDATLLIVIVTPYWYGVETTDGQHGWVRKDQVEPLP
jgi:hypothetical protein